MILSINSDARHALEVLMQADAGTQLQIAQELVRNVARDMEIGLVGRGFLRESGTCLQAVLDWIEVGRKEQAVRHHRENKETEMEAS